MTMEYEVKGEVRVASYIPDNIVAEIKHAADIVDIVSESVRLKKTGKNYVGLCPFHSEKTPSFTVSPEKQIFHCFGCGEGGDVFKFVMKQQGLDFPEALSVLARRCGIQLPSRSYGSANGGGVSERQRLATINRLAADFFRSCLRQAPGSERAARYLASRGISHDIMDEFLLGYAPEGWDNIVAFFRKKRVPLGLVEKAGLVIKNRAGDGYYDRFRDRIIFPITDVAGRVIGFGGRVLDDSTPKYLNSPETPLYRKGRSLYGLSVTKDLCRKEGAVFITEGYMDFLSLYASGVKNVVATLGTSLTTDHARILKGFVEKAFLVFDSDEAGMKAAMRGIDVLNSEKGLQVFILPLPDGHDPDSFVREKGADAFRKLALEALSPISFLVESAKKRHGLSVEGKVMAASEMGDYLAAVEDGVARSLYIKEVSERLGIEESAMLEKVRVAAERKARYSRIRNGSTIGPDAAAGQGGEPERVKSGEHRMELRIIEMMIHRPSMIGEVADKKVLDLFENDLLRSIGEKMVAHRTAVENGSADLVDIVEGDEARRIVTALCVGNELSDWSEDGCRRLMNQFLESRTRRLDNLAQRIKAAEKNRDYALLDELLKAKQANARKGMFTGAKGDNRY